MTVEGWKTVFDLSAVILLFLTFAAGVGVLITGNIINKRQESQLRQFDKDLTDAKTKLGEQQERAAVAEKELKEVDLKTEGFRLSIAQANERASKAQESLAKAEQHAKEADAKAEGFRLDIAKANERAASANETAEREKLARLQFEARLAPRTLSLDQIASVIKRIKQFGPQRIDVMTYPHDTEAEALANLFFNAFFNAGWKFNRFEPMDSEGITGIFIEFDRSDPKSIKAAQELSDEIRSSGLTVSGPAPSLPREYHIGYAGPQGGIKPDAPIRMTIGSK